MDMTDRDIAIRTILGEARNQGPLGQAGVAHVMLNRLASGKYGNSLSDVAFQKSAFEPWSTRARELWSISPSSEAYKQAGRILDASAAGAPDPTAGATHFANVSTVRDRNGGTVGNHGWINPANQTAQIGAHTFFAPDGPVTDRAPLAFAPTGGPPATGGPAMDAINGATQQQPDVLSMLRQSLANHASGASGPGGGFNPQDPMRGFLGRGLYNLFTGNGFHIGPIGPQQAQTPPSAAAGIPAAEHAMAGLPDQGTPAPDAPIPPTRPPDLPNYTPPPMPQPQMPPMQSSAMPPGTSNSPAPPPDAPDMSMGGGNPLGALRSLFGGGGDAAPSMPMAPMGGGDGGGLGGGIGSLLAMI